MVTSYHRGLSHVSFSFLFREENIFQASLYHTVGPQLWSEKQMNWHWGFLTAYNLIHWKISMPCTHTIITCHPEAHMGSIFYTWEFVTSWALAQQHYKEVKDGRHIRKRSFPPLRPIDILTVLYFCLLFILYCQYFDSFLYFYIPAFSFLCFLDERRSRKVMQLMWTCVAEKVQTKKIHHGLISRSSHAP